MTFLESWDPNTTNPGYCSCCRRQVIFELRGPWARDEYVCTSCGSIPRQRHLNHILERYFPGWEGLALHESSPSNDYVAKWCRCYSSSQLLTGVACGELLGGVRCENLEALTFAAESFDLFITQDVLEHVLEPDQAVREVVRVLKPGGAHVFTAPKNKNLRVSRPRTQLRDGVVVNLVEPEFHGNPVADGRSLVTWDYGDDFESLLWSWCGYPTTTYVTRDRSLGIDAEYIEVFVTRKIGG